ncbi:conserved domain protein [Acaryochloris marina MBIC11017]|uniref:Conserved domain protein n=2 Tax=Acaryochloris marina TaxID=155978 RepID=B0C4I4_ACAM1|nr:SUMF1/EgtB/PvdO family nonheme iron enzyme [Acaryochloris marina]ABW28727.1 conserved domain protein [Acaryochloris marina MBIC11017]BDM77717.1 hypothetical protein AM10699_05900 [Acaryochloris marina MBIC10699]
MAIGMGMQRRQFLRFGGTVLLTLVASPRSFAKSVDDIRKIARQITVKILTQGPSGSGILIQKKGPIYTVLTAAHVIKNSNRGEEAYAMTSDGENHLLDTQAMKTGSNLDLAIATFYSNKTYGVTDVGQFKALDILDEIYVGGYPLADQGISVSTITLTRGEVASIGPFEDGYGFSYTAVTKAGMSGGPILNQAGQLIGVHGRAAGQRLKQFRLKDGLNLGIPIDTAIEVFGLKTLAPTVAQPDEPEPQSAETDPPEEEPSSPSPDSPLVSFTFEVLGVNDKGQVRKRMQQSAQSYRQPLVGGVALEMVAIPGGQFTMGSPVTETHREKNEDPKHVVDVPAFLMGKYPITQAQWQAIMGDNPSKFQGANHPVDQVSWFLAEEFCQKLSLATGQDYRLPSEAEWEYAARAGTDTPFHFGQTITTDLANYDGNYAYDKGPKGTFRKKTVPVDQLAGNAFGLFNMHGQVWEWCLDHWHDTYDGAPRDGTAWVEQGDPKMRRVRRGGSWYDSPHACRSAFRYRSYPYAYTGSFGLRVVLPALNQTV